MTTLNFPLNTRPGPRSPNESWDILHGLTSTLRRTGSVVHNLADTHSGWVLIVHLEHAPRDHEVYQLALAAGLDYVAVEDRDGVRLIGPRAAEWRPFPAARMLRVVGAADAL
jgi:hypothetical protein